MRTDLAAGEPCRQGDCPACLSNPGKGGGPRHQRSGALYTGSCRLCPEQGRGTAVYTGESGFSGYERLCSHADDIRRKDQGNAFAKHLREEHPAEEGEGGLGAFNFDVTRTFTKPMEQQIAEAVAIHGCQADTVLNSRAEWEQPATERLVVTRELPEAGGAAPGGGGGRGAGRGGGRRGREGGGA